MHARAPNPSRAPVRGESETMRIKTALTIAGSDSGGGAGIQADLKSFAAFGVYGTSAITAITAQNTRGVFGVTSVPPEMVTGQIAAVLDDIPPDAIKIGMLGDAATVEAVAPRSRDTKARSCSTR